MCIRDSEEQERIMNEAHHSNSTMQRNFEVCHEVTEKEEQLETCNRALTELTEEMKELKRLKATFEDQVRCMENRVRSMEDEKQCLEMKIDAWQKENEDQQAVVS